MERSVFDRQMRRAGLRFWALACLLAVSVAGNLAQTLMRPASTTLLLPAEITGPYEISRNRFDGQWLADASADVATVMFNVTPETGDWRRTRVLRWAHPAGRQSLITRLDEEQAAIDDSKLSMALSVRKVYVSPPLAEQDSVTTGVDGVLTRWAAVRGFVAGAGRAGVRGRVITREGDLVGKSAMAGILSGFGGTAAQGLRPPTVVGTTVDGAVRRPSDRQVLADAGKAGLAQGVGNAGDRLAQYYISRAEQYQPVVSLKGGAPVEAVFIAGAKIFGKAITLYRIPQDIPMLIQTYIDSQTLFVIVVCPVLVAMGLVFEALSMVLIMVPVLLPAAMGMGIDPVWFGIFMVIMVECALITPPVGLNLHVIQSAAGAPLGEVAKGVLPFLALMILTVFVMYVLPDPALYIPFKL